MSRKMYKIGIVYTIAYTMGRRRVGWIDDLRKGN